MNILNPLRDKGLVNILRPSKTYKTNKLMKTKTKFFHLAVVAFALASMYSCSKSELEDTTTSGESTMLKSKGQNACTASVTSYVDSYTFTLEDWPLECVGENVNMEFTGHWNGRTVTSANCTAHDDSWQRFEATAVGLTTGNTYYIYGSDHMINHGSPNGQAAFYNQVSRLNIVNQTTGETFNNLSFIVRYHVNANGEVVIDYLASIDCN
jgi:hypothetical protein